MSKRTKITRLFLPLILLLLASCEGNTDRLWQVSNESSTTIQVEAKLVSTSDTVFETIEPNELRSITFTNEEKGNPLPQKASDVFSYFMITNANGDTLKKDFTDNDNWDIYIDKLRSNPDQFEHTYTMIATNKDF